MDDPAGLSRPRGFGRPALMERAAQYIAMAENALEVATAPANRHGTGEDRARAAAAAPGLAATAALGRAGAVCDQVLNTVATIDPRR